MVIMNKFPEIKLFDNFLKKEIILKPDVFISHDGRLVICYESAPQNYADFGNDDESENWSVGDTQHLTILSLD